MSIKIAIGSDHAGYGLKCEVIKHLKEQNIDFIEMGCMDGTSCDYPVVAKEVCDKVVDGTVDRAVLICGTGIGISMAANKVKGIRAALCTDAYMAKYTRLHNDANVLCLGEGLSVRGLLRKLSTSSLTQNLRADVTSAELTLFQSLKNNFWRILLCRMSESLTTHSFSTRSHL